MIDEGERERLAGNHAEAVGMFEMAAEKDAERPEPSYLIGRSYLGMADKQFREDDLIGALRYCDRAIASFDSAISSFPGYSKAVQGKADALKLRGKHQAAFEIARWVSAQSGFKAKNLIVEAQQYSSSGDLDNAQLSLQKAVAVDENNAIAHAELGRFYLRLNNREQAIDHLRRAYEINPGIPGVFEALLDLGAVTPDMR
ncbi:MAG TPA: tetratricopeptide repeat protein [Phycisphaerae bacterium]|nr:tetratricopeptide repeat protein [Phycisphaerae bacterium]